MISRLLHVSMGDPRDPFSAWCRWGGSDQDVDWTALRRRNILRFRPRRKLSADVRDGLRRDGMTYDGHGWTLNGGR